MGDWGIKNSEKLPKSFMEGTLDTRLQTVRNFKVN